MQGHARASSLGLDSLGDALAACSSTEGSSTSGKGGAGNTSGKGGAGNAASKGGSGGEGGAGSSAASSSGASPSEVGSPSKGGAKANDSGPSCPEGVAAEILKNEFPRVG
jgi:hypothetical protein